MIKPVKLPRGVANLFLVGDASEIFIPERWNHRPDKILDSIGQKSMKGELLNNYVSVASPITLSTGTRYVVTDGLYRKYFFNESE